MPFELFEKSARANSTICWLKVPFFSSSLCCQSYWLDKVITNHVIHTTRNKSFATHVNCRFNECTGNQWDWSCCERLHHGMIEKKKWVRPKNGEVLKVMYFSTNTQRAQHALHIRQNWHLASSKKQLEKSPLFYIHKIYDNAVNFLFNSMLP